MNKKTLLLAAATLFSFGSAHALKPIFDCDDFDQYTCCMMNNGHDCGFEGGGGYGKSSTIDNNQNESDKVDYIRNTNLDFFSRLLQEEKYSSEK